MSDENKTSFKDQHCLVIDDNPVNRMIMKAMLGQLGFTVHDAADLEVASTQAGERRCDVVFVDGIQRAHDTLEAHQYLFETAPVIAVVADVASQDSKALLSNRFSGLLARPVDLTELEALLQRVLAVDDGEIAAGDTPVIDIETFRALEKSVGQDAMEKLTASFINDATQRLEKMRDYLKESQWQPLSAEAHALGSSAGMFGAMPLLASCRALEAAFQSGDLVSMAPIAEEVDRLAMLSIATMEAGRD